MMFPVVITLFSKRLFSSINLLRVIPVSIASLANGIRYIALPVGSVTASTLTESQFQAQTASPAPETWILCDGRDVEGTLFSQSYGPDKRA